MTDFPLFSDNITVAALPRASVMAGFDGPSSLTVLSEDRLQKVNAPKRMVVGEKSKSSGYFPTFEAKQRSVRERFVARFSDSYMHAARFYMFDNQKRLLLESIQPAMRKDPSLLRESGAMNILEVKEMDGDFIVCGVHNYDNYFHWHVDCLSGLLLAEKAGVKAKILTPPLNSWRASSLAYMGLNESDLVPSQGGMLRLSQAYWPSSLVRRGFHMSDEVVEAFDRIRRGIKRADKLAPLFSERVYIGRTDTNVRKLNNELELISRLEARGYRVVTPGLFSYEEQISIMLQAKTIVSLHGAGLANMGFAPISCNIVEIFPETFLNNGYYGMAQVTQQSYHCYSKNTQTGSDTRSGQPSDWTIDVDDFIDAYKDIL